MIARTTSVSGRFWATWVSWGLLGLILCAACGRSGFYGAVSEVLEERHCDDGRDDDLDGLTDCADPDCAFSAACLAGGENCGNGIDDDGDGLIDCADPDCAAHRLCQGGGREICDNGRDDDGDGLVDCADPDCADDVACLAGGENCGNGIDDDGDGLIDCADPDCAQHRLCRVVPKEDCENGLDDDMDGLVDCLDLDCVGHPACGVIREICANGRDDDGDGRIDCDDPDCRDDPACAGRKEICDNRIDDDGDGLVDCVDPDCYQHPSCKKPPGTEICNNGIDDDDDGLIDCADSDCAALPICRPGFEDCSNGLDDDGDGAIDCADPDCVNDPACVDQRCRPQVDFGIIAARGGSSRRTLDNRHTIDVYDSPCAIPGGGEVVARFELAARADVRVDYEQLSGDHVLALFRAGVDQRCNENHVRCLDPQSAKSGHFVLNALPAGRYYLFAEAFAPSLEGRLTVTLSTGTAVTPEICNNGLDDDGDGAIDCADLDCLLDPACDSLQCVYDLNLGALVIGGPARTVSVDTRGAGDDIQESCAGQGGADRVIRLVMPSAGGLAVQIEQQGWHVFGLHRDRGPGTTCLADRRNCFDSNERTQFTVAYDAVERGTYYYGIDALDPSHEGRLTLSFEAYQNRGPELCGNGIDDDGDQLVDCLDPDCIGDPGCAGPVCVANLDAGVLRPGGHGAHFAFDTRVASDDHRVSCALGGGRDVVIAVELSEVSGLQIHCNQTGDHLIGLFGKVGPRDACDKRELNCADPSRGPIACHFVFPNLQPGRYYVIVEAFKPGDEGQMDLWLAAIPDHAKEICDNGVDDDGDGLIDCRDPSCANQPLCEGAFCVPELTIGLLQKDGPARDVSVTTQRASDSTRAECADRAGGGDAVLSFSLAQAARLHVDFAQLGDHVLALYADKGEGLPCDLAPLDCQPTRGDAVGRATFADLPAGEYHLVVDATSPAGEGAASLRLSAR